VLTLLADRELTVRHRQLAVVADLSWYA